jgi:uncharacterized protein YjbI with pentapeptide repeats
MAYLTMTVGAVTHEILLKQKPIVLPVLNVNLPLVGFFWIAPLFFLLFHFYLFLQLVILVQKVAGFDVALETTIATEQAREGYRKRLDSFVIVQFLCGAKEERTGMTGRFLRSIAFITLVVLPIALLLQFQLTFLPYHDPWVTWVHRIAILVDLRLSWVFWYAIRKGTGEIRFPELDSKTFGGFAGGSVRQKFREVLSRPVVALRKAWKNRRRALFLGSLIVFFSFFVFAFRDEPIGRAIYVPVPHISDDTLAWELQPISDAFLHGPINMVEGRPRAWFSNVLVVPNKKLIDDKAENADFPSLSLRGRNLSGAVLIGSDLRNVDFTGANLNEAHLERALLTHAKFRCGSTYDGRSKNSGWPADECTWLQLASLAEAQLQSADFERARMQGAVLIAANLTGAQFTGTQLQDAMLINAQLQAALIDGANLTRAFLNGAVLLGAKITNSELKGILIGETLFQLAYITHDWSKLRLAVNHDEPRCGSPDSGEMTGDSNDRVPICFMHAELRYDDSPRYPESITSEIDLKKLKKLRQSAVAQLAAANKMQNTDFDKVYDQAEETYWDAIDNRRNKDIPNKPSIKQYAIDFACDAGSSPYIMDGLVRDEKIMWVLNKISGSESKGQPGRDEGPEQAVELLDRFLSPKICAGAGQLSQTNIVAIGYMKQKIEGAAKAKAQLKKAENNAGTAGSKAAILSNVSISKVDPPR